MTPSGGPMSEREAFEKWARSKEYELDRDPVTGEYTNEYVASTFMGWQARAALPPAAKPEGGCTCPVCDGTFENGVCLGCGSKYENVANLTDKAGSVGCAPPAAPVAGPAESTPARLTLTVTRGDHAFVVQCHEHDIAAQGTSVGDALRTWVITYSLEEHRLSSIPPCPITDSAHERGVEAAAREYIGIRYGGGRWTSATNDERAVYLAHAHAILAAYTKGAGRT